VKKELNLGAKVFAGTNDRGTKLLVTKPWGTNLLVTVLCEKALFVMTLCETKLLGANTLGVKSETNPVENLGVTLETNPDLKLVENPGLNPGTNPVDRWNPSSNDL